MRKFNHWDITYRNDQHSAFKVVSPPSYGWVADPFLVEYNGEIYLFAEIFLYLSERNGVIGYCKYDGNRFGEWTVTMDRHWHLSYPFVFVQDEQLYMIPESYQLGEVVLYRLIEFPDRWEKVRSLISDVEYCDSTIFGYKDGKEYMLTFERGKKSPEGCGYIFEVEKDMLTNKQFISDSLEGTRCGGRVIRDGDKYIRIGQDCTREYGESLIFYEIDSVSPLYEEHELYRLTTKDIVVESKKKYIGLHTYNRLGDLEVIDLKYTACSDEEKLASDRVREVFLNKYR
ncbi:MAG: hypothetical protein IK152_08080 [Lachnospiraceae bacterium]|nr:hypothetical protein [Lachnospiraceae bacterium]